MLVHPGDGGKVIARVLATDSPAGGDQVDQSMSIVVRRRDPRVFVATTSSSSSSLAFTDAASSPAHLRGADMKRSTSVARANRDAHGHVDERSSKSVLLSLLTGRSISETFWVPSGVNHEIGLLETLYRRGVENRTHVLLQSRPLAELQFNFSTCTGYNIDLSSRVFRLSKTRMAMHHMDRTLGAVLSGSSSPSKLPGSRYRDSNESNSSSYFLSPRSRDGNHDPAIDGVEGADYGARPPTRSTDGDGHIRVNARDFSSAVRTSLQSLQEDNYYLVRYRDYSAWALQQYSFIAKRDGLMGRKYVEQCFAVHVSRDPGELIPITEAQFLFGVDIMQRQLLNDLCNTDVYSDTAHAGGAATGGVGGSEHGVGALNKARSRCQSDYDRYQLDINFSHLNADQFRSLGAVVGDGMRPMGVDGEELKRRIELDKKAEAARGRGGRYFDYSGGDYVAPAWYDWSPGAIRARVQHRLSMCYRSVGRLTVQVTVLGIGMYLTYHSLRRYLPFSVLVPGWAHGLPERADHYKDNGRGGGGYYAGPRGGGGGAATRHRMRGGGAVNYDVDDEMAYVLPRSFLRSVFMGPKSVFDYMLAPREMH